MTTTTKIDVLFDEGVAALRRAKSETSPMLKLGDQCYAAGIALAIATISGSTKDDELTAMREVVTPPRPKRTLRRKP